MFSSKKRTVVTTVSSLCSNVNKNKEWIKQQPKTAIRKYSATKKLTETRIPLPNGDYFDFKSELTRDFIHDSLYNPQYGYFGKDNLIIKKEETSKTTQLIDFTNLNSEYDYKSELSRLYKQGQNSWATPVEIFQPYYGRALAEYMIQQSPTLRSSPTAPLLIYEIGAGNGTAAKNILDYIRTHYPDIYQRTHYHIIEISSTLTKVQQETLKDHPLVFYSYNLSIFDWRRVIGEECFVLMMEVIDNFAHDKVVIEDDGTTVYETHVYETTTGTRQIAIPLKDQQNIRELETSKNTQNIAYAEKLLSLNDKWIRMYLELSDIVNMEEYYKYNSGTPVVNISHQSRDPYVNTNDIPDYFFKRHEDLRPKPFFQKFFPSLSKFLQPYLFKHLGGHKLVFLPTRQLMLLDVLKKYFPLHRLILADFDELDADRDRSAINSPAVQFKKKKYKMNDQDADEYYTYTLNTYLVPKGTCDIFFATDFGILQKVYSRLNRFRGSKIMKQKQFMTLYCKELEQTRCRNGFNPLLADYRNMSFFLS